MQKKQLLQEAFNFNTYFNVFFILIYIFTFQCLWMFPSPNFFPLSLFHNINTFLQVNSGV